MPRGISTRLTVIAGGKTSVTPEERAAIEDALRSGASQNAVAKQFGRSASTVNGISREMADAYSAPPPRTAIVARTRYAAEERLELLDFALAKARTLLETVTRPGELAVLSSGIEKLINAYRLEEGRATAITENRSVEVRERVMSRLDELEAQRRARWGVGGEGGAS